MENGTSLIDLKAEELELIAKYMDTESCLNLLRTCKTICEKLNLTQGFWKHLCYNEEFNECTALKSDDDFESQQQLTWSQELFHDLSISEDAPKWKRIFLRGISMRRNICQGKFLHWRLFLTENNYLPVKKMNINTSHKELSLNHEKCLSTKSDRKKLFRKNFNFNEEYFVMIETDKSNLPFNYSHLFVWKWTELQNPEFLYRQNIDNLNPIRIFHTAFFIWEQYLVFMPDAATRGRSFTSIIRVYDLNMKKIVGSYDLPEQRSQSRRYRFNEGHSHLRKIEDKAVALCAAPEFTIFVFSLPNCGLLREIPFTNIIPISLEFDEICQSFFRVDDTMIFSFYDHEFYQDSENNLCYGKLLLIDFKNFINEEDETKNGSIEFKIDEKFYCNQEFDGDVGFSPISTEKFAFISKNGDVVVRRMTSTSSTNICSHCDELIIPTPEKVKDGNIELAESPDIYQNDLDEMLIVLRPFKTGRKIHAYDMSLENPGSLIYTIDLDEPSLKLMKTPGFVSYDIHRNFFCALDDDKILIWNSRNGKFLREIPISPHYDVQIREKEQELGEFMGHRYFAFYENRLLIVQHDRNYPIAADVMLFW